LLANDTITRDNRFLFYVAALAINSDFIWTLLFGSSYGVLSPNWLLLPPIFLYVVVSGRAKFDRFVFNNVLIILVLGISFLSQMVYDLRHGPDLLSGEFGGASRQIFTSVVAYFIFFELVSSARDLKNYLDALAFSTAFNGFLLLCVAAGLLGPEIKRAWVGMARVYRFGLGDPNITFLYVALGAVYWLVLTGLPRGKRRGRFILAGLGLLGAGSPIVLGLSRGAFVAAAGSIGLGLILIFWTVSAKTSIKLVVIGGFAVGMAGILFVPSRRVDLFIARWTHFEANRASDSGSIRFASARWMITDLMTSPNWYGKGYSDFMRNTGITKFSHFSYTDMYIYGGAVPAVLFVIFIGKHLVIGTRRIRREPQLMARVYQITLIAYTFALLLMMASLSVLWAKVIWAALAVLAKCNTITRQEEHALQEWAATSNDQVY